MLSEGSRVRLVMPTISADKLQKSADWLDRARSLGVEVIVVCNSQSVLNYASSLDKAWTILAGGNEGFAHSINTGARSSGAWDVLFLANDDLEVNAGALSVMVAEAVAGSRRVIAFDPDPPKRLPDPLSIFCEVSLWSAVTRRLGRHLSQDQTSQARLSKLSPHTYKSFSAVSIGRTIWERLGGLDERMTFCYEDSDFCSRYVMSYGLGIEAADAGLVHSHSASTKAHIATVLPVVTHSAHAYLCLHGQTPQRARAVLFLALILRFALLPLARAPLRAHALGVLNSMRSLWRVEPPRLPRPEDI